MFFGNVPSFRRFLKLHYCKDYEITCCRNKTQLMLAHLKSYLSIIVMPNDVNELNEFLSIRRSGVKVVFCVKSDDW